LAPQIPLEDVAHDDLVAVADAVEAQPLGADLLRRTILEVADLRGAEFNYAHEVLALLLCEGAATVLVTNYDDCIERAAQPERLLVVRTAQEMLEATGAPLLKAHGCATQPASMLVSQAELDTAPAWATTGIAARLRTDRVAFIGIGSPADYVRDTVRLLITDIGVDHLVVADPALAQWDALPILAWRAVLPDLGSDQRDTRGAEEFCDALLRAYLHEPRATARTLVAAMPEEHGQRSGLEALLAAMEGRDAVWILRWLREASYKLPAGTPVATSAQAVEGLLAMGALLGETALERLGVGGWMFLSSERHGLEDAGGTAGMAPVELSGSVAGDLSSARSARRPSNVAAPVMLLMTHGPTLGATVEAEAHRRVMNAKGRDLVPSGGVVVVVVVGHIGPLGSALAVAPGDRLARVLAGIHLVDEAIPEDVVATAQVDHLIDGANAGTVVLVNGADLVEAA
jgi:hypothetical protein